MTQDVHLKMTFPIPCHAISGGIALLSFAGWLPMRDEEQIQVEGDNMELTLGVGLANLAEPRIGPPDELPRQRNLLVESVGVRIAIRGCEESLISYMMQCATDNTDCAHPCHKTFRELGWRVYKFVHDATQRLMSYFRSEKDQIWLEEREADPDVHMSFAGYRATFTIDGTNWYLWNPPSTGLIQAVQTGEDSWITREDWKRARAFMKTQKRSPMAVELLAKALADAWMGRRRSAVIDAVSALEVTINEFARSAKAQKAFGERFAVRMDIPSLEKQVEHLGLHGTVRYLLPVIFPEEHVPTELIKGCQMAINQRGSIIHGGNRHVSKQAAFKHIAAIRALCRILREYTDEDGHTE
jgi:hypothetical protein